MTVRRATYADIDRLADLNMEVQDLHVANMPDLFKTARREDLLAFFRETLVAPGASVFVACEGAGVVGYMLLVLRERLETPATHAQRFLYIEHIGVTEAYRGRGHATALIDAARTMAKEQRADRIELDTWGFNERAQRFFRSVGFEVRGIRMAMNT